MSQFSHSGTLFPHITSGLIRELISLVFGFFILLVFLFAKIADSHFLILIFFFLDTKSSPSSSP